MRLSDFVSLNAQEKQWTVLRSGVLIGKRKYDNKVAFLFQVDNFYVETFFNAHNKSVEEFRMFDQTELLQPYLDSIRIDELLN